MTPLDTIESTPEEGLENMKRRKGRPTKREFYGISEIAEVFGVHRNVVSQWHKRGKLPAPDAMLSMGPIWRAETINKWVDGIGEKEPTREVGLA